MEIRVHVSELVDLTGFLFRIHHRHRKEDEALTERLLKEDPVEQQLDRIRRSLTDKEHEQLDVFLHEDSAMLPALLPALLQSDPSLTAAQGIEKLRTLSDEEIRRHLFGHAYAAVSFDGNDPEAAAALVDEMAVPQQEKWKLSYYMTRPETLRRELADLMQDMYHRYYESFRETASAAADTYAAELNAYPEDSGHPVRRLVEDYIDTSTLQVIHVYPSWSLNVGFMLSELVREEAVHLSIGLQRFSLMESKMNEEELFGLLKVLTDERRFRLLRLLKKRPHYGYELAEALGVSNSTVSHHLTILLNHQFVQSHRAENRVYYKVNTEKIKRTMADVERMFTE